LRRGDPRDPAVIDFGLARMISNELTTRLTAERQMVGSPLYMAPEQADGSPEITGAVDVYALAGIAYALISGQPVFPGRPLLALIYAHAEEAPPRLSERCRFVEVPRLLDELLLACLGKRPADRPTSDELAAHLANLLAQAKSDRAAHGQIALDQTMAAPEAAAVAPEPARPAAQPPPIDPAALPEVRAAAGSLSVPGPPASPGVSGQAPSVRVSDSLVAEVVGRAANAAEAALAGTRAAAADPPVGSAGELLLLSARDDDPLREAWSNQILAVIMEIASALADRDPNISACLHEVDELHERVSNVELDLALLDSHLGETPVADRAALANERVDIAARTAALHRDFAAAQRTLVARVEGARYGAHPEVQVLFGELDEILKQARPVFARTRG
jgi:serine/threonine-protein kinase